MNRSLLSKMISDSDRSKRKCRCSIYINGKKKRQSMFPLSIDDRSVNNDMRRTMKSLLKRYTVAHVILMHSQFCHKRWNGDKEFKVTQPINVPYIINDKIRTIFLIDYSYKIKFILKVTIDQDKIKTKNGLVTIYFTCKKIFKVHQDSPISDLCENFALLHDYHGERRVKPFYIASRVTHILEIQDDHNVSIISFPDVVKLYKKIKNIQKKKEK